MGIMQRFQATIKAAKLVLGPSGIVDKSGNQLLGGTPNDSLTAHSGGGQSSAIALVYGWNRLSTVAASSDSVALPAAIAGTSALLINDGAHPAQVFGKNGNTDTIDGIAGSTGVVLTNAKRCWYYCLTTGAWQSKLGTESA